MQLFNLDAVDRKILELIQEDGRMSYAEIARHTHLSRVAVRDRVKSLVDRGIINRFTVQLSADAVGYSVPVFLKVSTLPSHYESVVFKLKNHNNLTQVFALTGEEGIHAMGIFRGLEDLNQFLREVGKLPGVIQLETNLILDYQKNEHCLVWKKA